MARGSPAMMPATMIMVMPLPMPRSVICSPSHITNRRAGGDRYGGDEQELRARVRHQVAAGILDGERRAETLECGQPDRAVARVLHQLAAAGFPVLANLRFQGGYTMDAICTMMDAVM